VFNVQGWICGVQYIFQGILQTCFDLEDLRGEVFCQLIKQTAGIRQEDADNDVILRAWQVRKNLILFHIHLKYFIIRSWVVCAALLHQSGPSLDT